MMRTIFSALVLLASATAAFGQAQPGPGQIMGNSSAASRPARAENASAIFDRAFGTAAGSVLRRGIGGWQAEPALGWYIVGSTDYPTIQSAITAASAAGSGTVWVPCGNYTIGTAADPATGIDATNTKNVRIIGQTGRNGGAAQCTIVTYAGTGTAVTYGGSIGFEWNNLYLRGLTSAKLLDGTTGAAISTSYSVIRDNFFQGQNGVTVIIDMASSQGLTVVRNAFTGGSIGIRGITTAGGIPAGQYAVKALIDDNSFQPSLSISGIQGLETGTVSNNIFQGQVTGYTSGPAGTCHRVYWYGNWHGDATTPQPLIVSNCNYFLSSSNEYNGGGAAAITQSNTTGTVKSDSDKFLGSSPWIALGTGNFLEMGGISVGGGAPSITGTPTYSTIPVHFFLGSVSFGTNTASSLPVNIRSQGSGISPRALQIEASDFGTNGGMLRINKDPGVGGEARIFSGGTATVDSFTIDSGILTLGLAGTALGRINMRGSTSGTVGIKTQAAAGTYDFNLPTSAGTAGQPLLSGGGGAAAQTYGTLGIAAGGTGSTTGAVRAVVTQTFCPSGCSTTIAGGASGTYTPTANMLFAQLECVGGGGGGGGVNGAASQIYGGGGGSSGSYSRSVRSAAAIGASQTVTIGGGGAGGAGAANGAVGTGSSIGTIVTTNGGNGGQFSATGVQLGIGGAPAAVGTGDMVHPGNAGQGGSFNATANNIQIPSGIGGASYFGGAPQSAPVAANSNGVAGTRGSGGSGAYTTNATGPTGGAGGAGYCAITEHLAQ